MASLGLELRDVSDACGRDGAWQDNLSFEFHSRVDVDVSHFKTIPDHSSFVYVGKLGEGV